MKKKILIADDNKSFCSFIYEKLIEIEEFEIVGIASTDEDEIKLIEEKEPDVVITDLKRNNEYIILPKIKVEEYFKLKEIEGLTVNDKKIKIIPIENDFDRYRSYRNVELSRYGTIEIRSDCTQNVKNVFNVVAFNVGISANIDEAFNKLKEKDTDERCWFKIAKKGLIRRKKGEEIFLNVGDNV